MRRAASVAVMLVESIVLGRLAVAVVVLVAWLMFYPRSAA